MAQKLHEIKAVAARYATALFDLALEQNKQEALASDLARLVSVCAEDASWQHMVRNPRIPTPEKAAAHEALLADLKADALTVRLVGFVVSQQRAEILPALAEAIQEKLLAHRGEAQADVVSAQPLSAAQQKQVAAALSTAAGCPVHVRYGVDAALIGGLTIRMGSRMLDRSVAGKLQRLGLSLVSSSSQAA